MTIQRYTLADIEDIIRSGIYSVLDESIIAIIQDISNQVGSPEYIKTPKFTQKEKHNNRQKQYTHEDWGAIRQFVPTQRIVRNEFEQSTDVIRKTLNKITSNTYNALYPLLIEELDKVVLSQHTELDTLGTTIFSIVSETAFYSEMYADLYASLHNKYEFLRKALIVTMNIFEENTKQILYSNPDEDYDAFCKNNKENTRRKSVAIFLVNLTKHNIVDVLYVCNIIQNIQERILTFIDLDNNNEMVDELSEISGDMIITGKVILNKCDVWENIVTNVKAISKMKPREHISLTNKTVFRHMDIIDHLNK